MSDRLLRTLYLGTVFITGAAVLIVEVIAVRQLAPYFGASLYVLSSVLTVVLLALALGYYAGGKLSDRLPYHLPLYTIITASGLTLLALTYLAQLILPVLGSGAPLTVGPLIFSLILFFLPAFLLGIDSPYVIKLLTQSLPSEAHGSIVGATFFWSTAGSITGSLLAGFVLVPYLGLTTTLVLTGCTLVVLGIGGGSCANKLLKHLGSSTPQPAVSLIPWILAALALAGTLSWLNITHVHTSNVTMLYQDDGYYSSIAIFETKYGEQNARFLRRDLNFSSAIYPGSDELVFSYTQFALLYPQLFQEPPERFLMLGGGAYTIPRVLHDALPTLQIDVVDLEPSLYPLAQQFFELPVSDRITNYVMDARPFLARSTDRYDFIFVDTFSSGLFIPPHLATREFMLDLQSHLTERGVVMVNFIGSQPPATDPSWSLTGSFTKTFLSVFPNAVVYGNEPEHPEQAQNYVFIARADTERVDLNPETVISDPQLNATLEELALSVRELVKPEDVIFTDDHSPVELLLVSERMW